MNKHYPVLYKEVLLYMDLKEDDIVFDLTLGAGGHASFILERIKRGFLLGFDQDESVIPETKKRLSSVGSNFKIIDKNFKYLKEEAFKNNIYKADKILMDLGTSSMQMDSLDRGFSYHTDQVLDMRMDKRNKLTAKEVVNTYDKEALIKILRDYSDEKYAVSIASNIVKYREKKEINTTFELSDIVKQSVPFKYSNKKHPARKTFQAIRCEVNSEIKILDQAIRDALDMLNVNGRLLIISFQTKEDTIVKKIFNEVSKEDMIAKGDPFAPKSIESKFKKIKKIKPSKEEIKENYRSRSAILRVIEKIRD